MSCETTFERDLHAVRDRPELSALFTALCERVAQICSAMVTPAAPLVSNCATIISSQ